MALHLMTRSRCLLTETMVPSPPPPYGFAAFWPQNATVYDGTPIQADPTTWGTVTLAFHNLTAHDVVATNVTYSRQ